MNFSRIFNILKLSFYSKEFYYDVYKHLNGIKFIYLLILLTFSSLTVIAPLYGFTSKMLNFPSVNESEVNYIISQLPEMNIKSGLLHVQSKDSIFAYSKDNKKILVVDVNAFQNKYRKSKIPVFINRYGIFIFASDKEYSQSFQFKDFFSEDKLIDSKYLKALMNTMRSNLFSISFFVFYPITIIMKSFVVAVNIAIFALLGLLYAKAKSNKLNFKSLYRVAVFAMVPPLLVNLIIDIYFTITRSSFFALQEIMNSPFKTNAIFFISVGYFYFALKSCIKFPK